MDEQWSFAFLAKCYSAGRMSIWIENHETLVENLANIYILVIVKRPSGVEHDPRRKIKTRCTLTQ